MAHNLYAFGSNGSRQLGVGHGEDVNEPALCQLPTQAIRSVIKSIKAGGNHTLVLTNDGTVWAAGDIKDGRAGCNLSAINLEDSTDASQAWNQIRFPDLEMFSTLDLFTLATTTWEGSVLVSRQGTEVYTCGKGSKGELGLGEERLNVDAPVFVRNFPPNVEKGVRVVDVASCMSHTVAVLSNGEVWGWGAGRKGQLGEPAGAVWRPRRIEGIPFPVVKAACGREFTVVAASPEGGSFLIIGSDKYGARSAAPSSIEGWKQIEASWSGVYVLFQDGQLLAWGRNDRGQLPSGGMPLLEQIAAGSEHVLARTENGRVLAWGWGEHGNCGKGAKEGERKLIQGIRDASFVGAGCATSFIAISGS